MRITERLRVNGDDIPISGYSINTPTDGLGQSVTIALAKPDINSIPLDADIVFEIGASVWDDMAEDFATSYAPAILANGKLVGRTYTVKWIPDERGGYPGDVIEFSSISPIADKWSMSPAQPIVLYDPQKINAQALLVDPNEAIRYNNIPILPLLVVQEDLNSIAAVKFCYEALGFSRIITSLGEPFPVDRVDISLEGGYHEAAKSIISFLDPLAFEHDGILWIIDPEEGLPSGLTVKQLSPNALVEVVQSLNPEITSNAVIVSYKNLTGVNAGEIPRESFITEPAIESGSGKDYTRTEVTRHITEFFDSLSEELRRTEEHEIVTKHFAYRDLISVSVDGDGAVTRTREPGGVILISTDTLENSYIGNQKQGHTRTVEGVYSNPEDAGRDAYGILHVEEGSLTYGVDNSHPGENVLERSEVKTRGLVLMETKEDGLTVFTPIVDAGSGNIIESDGSQSLIHDTPIETFIERLRQTSSNQSNIETLIIDHLGGALRTIPAVQSRTGSRSTFEPPFALEGKQRGHRPGYIRELIKDEESVAELGLRRPVSLDVGSCDPQTARRLARRRLQRLTRPPKRLSITLPGIDFSLRRGSLILCPLRSGFDGKAIVTGHNITASGIGTPAARRVQTLEARELIIDNP